MQYSINYEEFNFILILCMNIVAGCGSDHAEMEQGKLQVTASFILWRNLLRL